MSDVCAMLCESKKKRRKNRTKIRFAPEQSESRFSSHTMYVVVVTRARVFQFSR